MTPEQQKQLLILSYYFRNLLSDLCNRWRIKSHTICSPFTYCAYDLEQALVTIHEDIKGSDIAELVGDKNDQK